LQLTAFYASQRLTHQHIKKKDDDGGGGGPAAKMRTKERFRRPNLIEIARYMLEIRHDCNYHTQNMTTISSSEKQHRENIDKNKQ